MAARLRNQNGETQDLTHLDAVEFLDTGGNLGAIITTDKKGTVTISVPGDPLFIGYCKTHGMKACKTHRHKLGQAEENV
jgi:hypothetical protein